MTRARIPLLIIALLVGLAVFFLQPSKVPALSGENLKGQVITTEGLAGRPYLVNFWATSCVTCVREMPDLTALHLKFAERGFETLAIAMKYDPREFVYRFAEQRGLPFQVIPDVEGKWAEGFGQVSVTPTTFLVDGDGQIVKRFVGVPDFDYLKSWLDKTLPKKS